MMAWTSRLLLFLSLAFRLNAGYNVIYRNSDGKVVAAVTSGSVINIPSDHTLVQNLSGNIPAHITLDHAYESGQLVDKRAGKYFLVVADNVWLTANGSSQTTIRITLTDSGGNPVTSDSSTVVDVSATLGTSSNTTKTLSSGTCSVTLTSTSEGTTKTSVVYAESTWIKRWAQHPNGYDEVEFRP